MAYCGVGVLMLSALLTAGYLLPITIQAFFPGKEFDQRTVMHQRDTWRMWLPLCLLTGAADVLGMFPGGLEPLMYEIVAPLFA